MNSDLHLKPSNRSFWVRPLIAFVIIVALSVVSLIGLAEIIPWLAPVAASPIFPYFYDIHDLLILGIILLIAYKYSSRVALAVGLAYFVIHVPYFFIHQIHDLTGHRMELLHFIFSGFIGLFSIWIIYRLHKSEKRIRRLAAVLGAIRNVNQLITLEKNRENLIQKACEFLVQRPGYEKAWILLLDENRNFVTVTGTGLGENASDFLKRLQTGDYPLCVRELLAQEHAFITYEQAGDLHKGCVLAEEHSAQDVFRGKLEYDGNLYGVIGVSVPRGSASDEEELSLLRELCGDIGFALANIEVENKQKRMEKALRNSEEKLRLMFESVAEGIAVTDLNGVITDVNSEAVAMFGLSSKDNFVGKSVFEFITPADREKAGLSVGKIIEKGRIEQVEISVLRADGSRFYVQANGSLLRDSSGDAAGIVAALRDITEHKRMEEQLIAQDRLVSIGQLVSGVAHELNNPLTSVIGFSELLLQKDLPDDVKGDLNIVASEAKRTSEIVKNLLAFARQQPQVKQPLNINELIQAVLQLRAYEQSVNDIKLNTRLAPNLPLIVANGSQLRQVFFNIVVNAEQAVLEAHNKGTLTVTTEKMGDFVRASFTDDGPGISKENMARLFAPFFTTKGVGKGTGLGLSISQGIISEHGGKIWAESEPGKGTTFIVELPSKIV